MSEDEWSDRRQLKGYRPDQVAAAFDRVRDVRDWKAPIRANVHDSDRGVVAVAVEWFTGTTAQFYPAPGAPDRWIVEAPGQRLGPGGVPDELPRSHRAVVAGDSGPPVSSPWSASR